MSHNALRQAAIDQEYRNALLQGGVAVADLPETVEDQDQSFLDLLNDDMSAVEIFACGSSCSYGPFTVVCDGGTK